MTSEYVVIQLTLEIDEYKYIMAVREPRDRILPGPAAKKLNQIMKWLTRSLIQTLEEYKEGQ